MAIDWVLLATTAGAGIAGGTIASVVVSLISKAIIRKAAETAKEKTKMLIEECLAKEKTKLRNKMFDRNKDCFSCEELIPKNAAYCAFCGIPVAGTKKCGKCGISLPNTAKYCYVCRDKAVEKKSSEVKVIHVEDSKKKVAIS